MATRKDYKLIADAMRRVITNYGPDMATVAQRVFAQLSEELDERFDNFNREKFDAAWRV